MTTKEYEVGENVAGDYIKAFIGDVKNQGMTRISFYKGLEGIMNFRDYFAKRNNLTEAQVLQGVNEIDLAIYMYNSIDGKENLN